jgi:hypothetical protein
LFCSKVAWLIGPGIIRGNFKGRYTGRIGKKHKQNLNLLGAPDLQLIFNQLLFKDGFYKQAASGLGFTFGEYT